MIDKKYHYQIWFTLPSHCMEILMKQFGSLEGKITLEDIKSLNAFLKTEKAIQSEVETYGGSENL